MALVEAGWTVDSLALIASYQKSLQTVTVEQWSCLIAASKFLFIFGNPTSCVFLRDSKAVPSNQMRLEDIFYLNSQIDIDQEDLSSWWTKFFLSHPIRSQIICTCIKNTFCALFSIHSRIKNWIKNHFNVSSYTCF